MQSVFGSFFTEHFGKDREPLMQTIIYVRFGVNLCGICKPLSETMCIDHRILVLIAVWNVKN